MRYWLFERPCETPCVAHNSIASQSHVHERGRAYGRILASGIAGRRKPPTNKEQWCKQYFVDTLRRDETDRFAVRQPFRGIAESKRHQWTTIYYLDECNQWHRAKSRMIATFVQRICHNMLSNKSYSYSAHREKRLQANHWTVCWLRQKDIVIIIITWRFHRIGFTADVQKMYLQVKVDSNDIEY